MALELRAYGAIAALPADAWDDLVGVAQNPFLEHRWLSLLEESGCTGQDKGWIPRHLAAWEGDRLVAACPAYVKLHSMGEFVYDWAFADFARRVGTHYYPKLVACVPFTPATGPRLLVAPGEDVQLRRSQLAAGLNGLAEQLGCAGAHVLFPTREEAALLSGLGGSERLQFQFHWRNDGYRDFDDFLSRFQSRKRKKIKRERRAAREAAEIRVLEGDALRPEHIAAMFRFYQTTCWQFGGRRYLTEDFWDRILDTWRDRLVIPMAFVDGRPVAGAFCARKGQNLYGRYWGCDEELKCLHFEVCYYAMIEWSIANRIQLFEPGQGGGHKYDRGFEPSICHSNHWFSEPRLELPLRDYIAREAEEVRDRVEALLDDSPIRRKGSTSDAQERP